MLEMILIANIVLPAVVMGYFVHTETWKKSPARIER